MAALLLLASSPSHAFEWTEHHTLFATSTIIMAVDWGLTLDIENHKAHEEKNPILGKHPSRGKVNRYFAGLSVLHLGSNLLIQNVRNARVRRVLMWVENYAVTMTHGTASISNLEAGLSINF